MINHKKIIVIGCSAGGLQMLLTILKPLSPKFPHAIIIVQHLAIDGEELLMDVLQKSLKMPIHEAIAEEHPKPGNIYVAPGDHHLLIERDGSFNLSLGEKVIGSRPSIDVLMETAADAFKNKVIAILLTGNSSDGANGIKKARQLGATTYVQDPKTADYPTMPEAAVGFVAKEQILTPDEIGQKILEMDQE